MPLKRLDTLYVLLCAGFFSMLVEPRSLPHAHVQINLLVVVSHLKALIGLLVIRQVYVRLHGRSVDATPAGRQILQS